MLNELSQEIHKTAVEKGWWDEERCFGTVIANVHGELSEAWEEYRSGRDFREVYSNPINNPMLSNAKPEGIPIELADVIIRILDFCGKRNIDIDKSIELKMAYNQTRSYRHGNKKA